MEAQATPPAEQSGPAPPRPDQRFDVWLKRAIQQAFASSSRLQLDHLAS